jgi:hypothetical protein
VNLSLIETILLVLSLLTPPPEPPAPALNSSDADSESSLEDEEGHSDHDSNLTDNDGGSLGDNSSFGPPDLSSLMKLDSLKCRSPTQVAAADGAKEVCACGQEALSCQQHFTHHATNCFRHAVGYYPRMKAVRGPQVHDKVSGVVTIEEYDSLRGKELNAIENLVGGFNDNDDEDDFEKESDTGRPLLEDRELREN